MSLPGPLYATVVTESDVATEPVWRDCTVISNVDIPAQWRDWLFDQGSLTRRLTAASHGAFRVQILRQRVARPQLSERRILQMPERHLALVREVLLLGNEEPWVYARSVLPLSSLTGQQRCWRKLDHRPLGALLFADPGMRRGAMQISRINPAQLSLPGIANHHERSLWGRRSVFYIKEKPLLVGEIFLPTFCPYNKPPKP